MKQKTSEENIKKISIHQAPGILLNNYQIKVKN